MSNDKLDLDATHLPNCVPGDDCEVDCRVPTRAALCARVRALEAMGTKVNAIRDSIVGMQGFNFSEHAYPLVAALNEAGFMGADYPETRKNLGTLIEQCDAAISRAEHAEAACAQMRACFELLRESHSPAQDARAWAAVDATLDASDVGAGYVSPEAHAEVVRERDEVRAEVKLIRDVAQKAGKQCGACNRGEHDNCSGWCFCRSCPLQVERDEARAQLAEAHAGAAVLRDALDAMDFWIHPGTSRGPASDHWVADMAKRDAALATDAGRALAARLPLLEAVVAAAEAFLEWQRLHHGVDSAARSGLCTALAALDANDKAMR